MVEMLNARGEPDGQCAVAIDSIGAGCGSGCCWSAAARRDRRTHRRLSGRSVRDWYRG
jgi:microcompartment protein CcmK/EutM